MVLRPYVEKAQERLARHGFLPAGGVDGAFGSKTESAVRAFQAALGLTIDGVIGGNQTWPALLAEIEDANVVTVGAGDPQAIAPDDPGPAPDPLGVNPPGGEDVIDLINRTGRLPEEPKADPVTQDPAGAGFFVALAQLVAAIGALFRRS